jgi:hypothetical protein
MRQGGAFLRRPVRAPFPPHDHRPTLAPSRQASRPRSGSVVAGTDSHGPMDPPNKRLRNNGEETVATLPRHERDPTIAVSGDLEPPDEPESRANPGAAWAGAAKAGADRIDRAGGPRIPIEPKGPRNPGDLPRSVTANEPTGAPAGRCGDDLRARDRSLCADALSARCRTGSSCRTQNTERTQRAQKSWHFCRSPSQNEPSATAARSVMPGAGIEHADLRSRRRPRGPAAAPGCSRSNSRRRRPGGWGRRCAARGPASPCSGSRPPCRS